MSEPDDQVDDGPEMSPMIMALDQWQRFDPHADAVWAGADASGTPRPEIPLNRISVIRSAISDRIVNPIDNVTLDVIGLLFDYIFSDPSIPQSMRGIFAKLQVPMAKAALLDRKFFSDKSHPARRLLDDLAAAAVGAESDSDYLVAFEAIASVVVAEVCDQFKSDPAVFSDANAKLQTLIAAEQERTSKALSGDVADALDSEDGDKERREIGSLLRERLDANELPFTVRWFAETVWVGHLTNLAHVEGRDGKHFMEALRTLDQMLWSIQPKDPAGERASLSRLIPSLIPKLRAGIKSVQADPKRTAQFFDELCDIHLRLLQPHGDGTAKPASVTAVVAANDSSPTTIEGATPRPPIRNVQNFIEEMAVGTWLAFEYQGNRIEARLFWISPLRSKYIFTTRSRSLAIALTAEELAWQIGTDKVAVIIEPVPLFDRAINNALNILAANQEYPAT